MAARDPALTAERPARRATVLLALIAGLTLYRLAVREWLGLGLHYDEAQYFVWSLDPAFGYFSKPPLLAWAIAVSRAVCGDGTFCVRLPSALVLALATWIVFLIGRRLFDERTAFWSAVIFLLAPLVVFLTWFVTTDSLLLLAWSAALYGTVRALQAPPRSQAALGWWLATGAAAGMGLMTKYTMGIFALCALGYLATSARHRPHLRSAGPWLGAALAALILAPNLLWNATHQFATFGHTATISQLDDARPSAARAAQFALAQFGVFGPLTMVAFLAMLAPGSRRAAQADAGRGEAALLLWFSLPFLCVIGLQAFAARAHANWAAPAYVAASLLAAVWLLARPARWLVCALLLNVAIMLAFHLYRPLLNAVGRPLARDPAEQLLGWAGLGRAVAAQLESGGRARLVVDERRLMSWLIYYAGAPARDALSFNPEGRIDNHYRLLRDVGRSPTGPFLLVSETDRGAELTRWFDRVEPIGVVRGTPEQGVTRAVYAWRLGDYRGPVPARAKGMP